MGIYIPDMEMPKDGAFVEVLIWSDGHVTKTGDSYFAEDGKAYYRACDWEYFSAIPVPDHGRLIDADALEQDAQSRLQICNKYDNQFQKPYEVMRAIALAPTVIPASREEEDS